MNYVPRKIPHIREDGRAGDARTSGGSQSAGGARTSGAQTSGAQTSGAQTSGGAPPSFATALGIVGLLMFPLAGAALVMRLIDPFVFVAISFTGFAVFGAATMHLHRA